MAISIINEPLNINPAYNDAYISFTSDLNGDTRAVVKVSGFEFSILPNPSGVYHFNLIDVVKGLFEDGGVISTKDVESDGFRDVFETSNWLEKDHNLFKSSDFTIMVFNNNGNSETITVSYNFNKGVKQFGDTIFQNNLQLLHHTTNAVDYNLTYFEGYPFDISIQSLVNGNDLVVKNLNNGTSKTIGALEKGINRLVFDKGQENWTTTNILPLPDLLNQLETYTVSVFGEVFRNNINLKKVPSKCGVYLKWFNSHGGYSYWLFDEFIKDELSASDLDEIGNNKFQNIGQNTQGNFKRIGKEGAREKNLRTRVDFNERYQIEDIITSPYVAMYTSNQPFTQGKWIDVDVSTKRLQFSTKKALNDVSITIELPKLNTQTL